MLARFLVRVLLGALIIALTTWHFGWLSVPVVGFVWGLTRRVFGTGAITAAVAAALAWGAFLFYASMVGDVTAIADLVASSTEVAPRSVTAGVILFPALLAWGGALVGEGIGSRF